MANQSKPARDIPVVHPRLLRGLERVKRVIISVLSHNKSIAAVNNEDTGEEARFEKFLNLPVELQDKIWEYCVVNGTFRRDVHINLKLTRLSKKLLKSNITGPSQPRIRYTPSLLYSHFSAPPPVLYSISPATRNLAFKSLPHKLVLPLPLLGPNRANTITRLIPLNFKGGDTLAVTFPFASEAIFEWLAFHLSPGFTGFVRPPVSVVGELEGVDRRVLKGSGALVTEKKKGLFGLGLGLGKQRSTVLRFKLCEIGEGLDVTDGDVGRGRVVVRLRGVPVGEGWDVEWIALMERLEVEGELGNEF